MQRQTALRDVPRRRPLHRRRDSELPSRKFITAASCHEGALNTSTTTDAPFIASASPSPVRELRPELGDAATTSCPCSRNLITSFDPISPLPPKTTIFMIDF